MRMKSRKQKRGWRLTGEEEEESHVGEGKGGKEGAREEIRKAARRRKTGSM